MGSDNRIGMKVIPGGNQMSLIRDTEEVLKFLEFAGRKSILNEHAIHNRLTACNNLFGVLNEEEDSLDYILSNLDVLVNRFRNRNNNVRASTLKVYKSRVKSSIEDFKAWSADPFAWERAVTDKAKAAAAADKHKDKKQPVKPAGKKAKVALPVEEEMEASLEVAPVSSDAVRHVSFPIRKDFCVEMTLPPEGITLKELKRLGLFLYPYCQDIDPGSSHGPL
ncbi:hypothetical protein K2X33_16760 [bacterium]|nr:hypothetical protein [bacterium]